MAEGIPPPPKPSGPASLPTVPKPAVPPSPPIQPPSGIKKETMRLTPPPKPALPSVPSLPKPPVPTSIGGASALPRPSVPVALGIPKPVIPPVPGAVDAPSTPPVPGPAKPPADLRKETMRISLPPRPAVAGGKPTGPGATVSLPPSSKPSTPRASPAPQSGQTATSSAGASKAPSGFAGSKPSVAVSAGVQTVVDTDSGGTALAIAALVASLISFGVVLMSFLAK